MVEDGFLARQPTIQPEDNILEEAEYLTDSQASSPVNCESEDSDWDSSTLSLVAYTPQRAEFSGYHPLQRVISPVQQQAPYSEPYRRPATGILSSIRSPNTSRLRRPRFDSYHVDNRARTQYPPTAVDLDEVDDQDSEEDDIEASALSYGATKYIGRPSLSVAPPQRSLRSTRMSLESPASHASMETASSIGSRRFSMMSYRSSTSMSLLFGEVINLEDQSRYTADSNRALSPLAKHDIDIEVGGLEGIEIGGGTRPAPNGQFYTGTREKRPRLSSLDVSVEAVSKGLATVKRFGQVTSQRITSMASKTKNATQNVIHSYRPPLSPSARALDDLAYLQQAHKEKVGQLVVNSDMEDHYDFVLLLRPQEVYRYWAELLDFRVEHLGDEFLDTLLEPISETASTNSTATRDSTEEVFPEEYEPLRPNVFVTPSTGMRRRTRTEESLNTLSSPLSPLTRVMMMQPDTSNTFMSPSARNGRFAPFTSGKRLRQRQSMFEKAIGVPSSPSAGALDELAVQETPLRRRWGNQALPAKGKAAATLLSPPVRSLTRGESSVRKARTSQGPDRVIDNDDPENTENQDPNSTSDDYPNPVIPRGIAARTNGMLPFLSALKRGFVVRRHRPGKDALFCRIFSNNGGDTIQYHLVDPKDAMEGFKEQRVRHNRGLVHGATDTTTRVASDWAYPGDDEDGSMMLKFNMPDHVAASRYREKLSKEHGIKKQFFDIATKAANSGMFRAKDLVAVHPAAHLDPRYPGVRRGELGTVSLRKSKTDYNTAKTFSIVVNATQRFSNKRKPTSTTKTSKSNENNKWYSGEGNDIQFKVLDFEAASEGEYWLIFRGFLLLQRDVVVGRFAKHRRAGIGGGKRNSIDQNPYDLENILHRDEFLEPATVGCIERAIVNLRKLDKTYMEGAVSPNAVPPPSDYFLGFKSPGTQIWSRLRLAGLETTRVYGVDPRRVMIKIRCPEDRLTDVAEVLRVKMKTWDDIFAPFQENAAHLYRPLNDPHDVPALYQGGTASLLRSKDRQKIIDFIIGSRIRDSGAELGPTTDLGRMVQARIPLHMRSKLESLFRPWVFYWRIENWTGRYPKLDREHLKAQSFDEEAELKPTESEERECSDKEVPSFLTRVFVGAFFQPLDAIEEYFGEQVTFYFAWLQHCARHLLVLTVLGLIVTACQMFTNNADHPIRPFFSIVVMLWTFMVLLNWRKRSNFLAYKWGSMDHKDKETPRPEFHGDYVVDEITGEWVVTYPAWKRWLKYTISVPIACFFTFMAVLLILLVHANRDLQMAKYVQQYNDPTAEPFEYEFSWTNIGKRPEIVEVNLTRELLMDPTFWLVMGALPALLGLCIPILNFILMRISVTLNNFENYRTESEYRTHLIIKVFGFRFVSQFGTLYYYAAISIGDQQSVQNGLIRMATSLMIYTTVSHWWSIFLQVYFFMFIRNIRRYLYRRRLQQELKQIEIEEMRINPGLSDAEARQLRITNKRMLLDQAQDDVWIELMNPQHDSFPEYVTAVLQFSFVACFSVVLPITPLFCLFNYLLSMRYDAYKLCRGRRRPLAKKTGGIGIWEHLLHIVAVVAVLTNCCLVAFMTADFAHMAEEGGQMWMFAMVVASEHVMLLIKYMMQNSMSALPKVVRDQMKRNQHKLDTERFTVMRKKNHGRRGKTEKKIPSTSSARQCDNSKSPSLDTIASFETASDADTVAA